MQEMSSPDTRESPPFVEVIIASYNGESTVAETIRSIKAQITTFRYEVLVVDDGSADGTVAICKDMGARVMQKVERMGLANSLNLGINGTESPIVVIMEQDILPIGSRWLQNLVEPLLDRRARVATSLLVEAPPSSEHCMLERAFRSRSFPRWSLADKGDAFERTLLSEIGLYDERTYKTCGEDLDMAYRLRTKGIPIAMANCVMLHNTLPKRSSKAFLSGFFKYLFRCGSSAGAFRRRNLKARPGRYSTIGGEDKWYFDPMFQLMVVVGLFVPYLQLACLVVLVLSMSISFNPVRRELGIIRALGSIFAIGVAERFVMPAGFVAGFLLGRQV